MSSSIDTAYRAAHFDQIHCDDEACTAVLRAQDLTHESSIALAHQHGWQAWMGSLRSYHRCVRHALDVTASPGAREAQEAPTAPPDAPERFPRGTEPPEVPTPPGANHELVEGVSPKVRGTGGVL